MKLKTTLMVAFALVAATFTSHAATMLINNVNNGPGDTLFAGTSNALLSSGIVGIGYFPAGIADTDINTAAKLLAQIGTFTAVTTEVPGSSSASLGGSFPGYIEQSNFTSIGLVTPTNQATLLGRSIYEICANTSSLTAGTAFSMVKIGTLLEDGPIENQYVGNPAGKTPLVGTLGTFNGDAGGGSGTYNTLDLVAVPETSATLLGALGALGLLRRRRI